MGLMVVPELFVTASKPPLAMESKPLSVLPQINVPPLATVKFP